MPRKKRGRTLPPQQFLQPININDFGNPEKDPCFGKLYDLTEPECQNCGDFELCAMVFQEHLKKKRIKAEKEVGTKDLQLSEMDRDIEVVEFYEDLLMEGETRLRSLKKTRVRYSLSWDKVKLIINTK